MTRAEKQFRTQRKEFEKAAKGILDLLPENSSENLLDVGCGLGWVVREAGSRGFEASGIDKDSDFVVTGKQRLGVNLKSTSLENFKTEKKFNVVILNHVLEHIVDVETFLKKTKSLMAPHGILLVACPNFNSLLSFIFRDRWYGLQPMEHRWQFTPKSLAKLLEENGFTIQRVETRNMIYNPSGWKKWVFLMLTTIAKITNLGDLVTVTARYEKTVN